jgi:FMN phosphatase YigB (HAD superfamily)
VTASESLFVGDGGSDEHRGARRVGLRTALVTRHLRGSPPGLVDGRRALADEHHHDVPDLAETLLAADAAR